jgi:putative flippase GtrA
MSKIVLRYGIAGVVSNALGFIIYVLLTWNWLDPKIAITLLYPIGAFIAYYGNSKFTFSYAGSHFTGLLRYSAAHLIGYMANVLILFVFVDLLGYSHLLIQAIAIFAVAGVLFLLFRYYVFR